MSREEHANGERNAAFPEAWGHPRGTPGSEERSVWVMNNVRRHVHDRRLITDPELREVVLERKMTSDPGLREALLERKRLGP